MGYSLSSQHRTGQNEKGANMKLTKKHLGQLFDNKGADGSWAYQLVDIKKGELLFYVFGSHGRYEVDSNDFGDWLHFKPQIRPKRWDIGAWETARRSPYAN